MTNQTSSSKARPWRNFSFTVLACLASTALLSAACSSTGTDDMGSGGSGTDTGGATTGVGGGAPGVGGGITGAGGGTTGAGGGCDVPDLLNKRCGTAICHGTATDPTADLPGNVNLLAPGVESRLYNVDAKYENISSGNLDCPTTPEKLIVPGNLQGSLMYTKVNGGHACGSKMPNVGTMNEEQIACYNDWLAGLVANPPQ